MDGESGRKHASIGTFCLGVALMAGGCPATGVGVASTPRSAVPDPTVIPAVDDASFPGAKGPIRLQHLTLDRGGATSSVAAWRFEQQVAGPASGITRPIPLYKFVTKAGQPVGHPVFSGVPGIPGYSPYWTVHVVVVPDAYVADSLRSVGDVQAALADPKQGLSEQVRPIAINCPVVAQHALLEGEPDATPSLAWFEGKRLYQYTFDTVYTVGGLVPVHPLVAAVPRDGDLDLFGADAATTSAPPAGYDPGRAVPAFDLNQDLGAGAGLQTGDWTRSFPAGPNPTDPRVSSPAFPDDSGYSALFRVAAYVLPTGGRLGGFGRLADVPATASTPLLVNEPLFPTLVQDWNR